MSRILITGGAGFIGKRLALSLRAVGNEVVVVDNFHPQVHSDPSGTLAELQSAGVQVVEADVRDGATLTETIANSGAETIVHLAAETGTGQSYDLPAHYCDVNVTGTARLLEAMRSANARGVHVRRVLLAGSRAVYGEGACLNDAGTLVTAVPRLAGDLTRHDFMPKDHRGTRVAPVASCAATTVAAPASIYASTKLMQEYVLRQGLEQAGIECVILRLQNVYGAGQALHNPYTGVLSIFVQQLLDGRTLEIYEDGQIVRDFVHVSDVVAAFHRACEMPLPPADTVDVGSGNATTILEVAKNLISILGLDDDRIRISGKFRPGDIRHAVADISAARDALSWGPKVTLDEGLASLVQWARAST